MASLETEEPRKAIRDKEVKVRAAAARDLGRIGTWNDLPMLIELATAPRGSAAVAVYAAAAATDIVHRLRLADELSRKRQEKLLGWVSAIDPDDNPGLLMLMSAVRTSRALSRLGRMLRGQRFGVRSGAAKALRRRGAPLDGLGDDALRDSVGSWLRDPAMRRHADTLLELVNLVGELGWTSLREEVRDAVGIERLHGEAVERALSRLDAQEDVSAWSGVWQSDGRDVSEVGEPSPVRWLIIDGDQVYTEEETHTLTLDAGPRLDGEPAPGRLGWFERLGEFDGPQPALQLHGQTWWRLEGKALAEALAPMIETGEGFPAQGWARVALELAECESVAEQRTRALALWRAGELEAAAELLDALIAQKKSQVELRFWRARVAGDAGQSDEAKTQLERFLSKAGKKAARRSEAEALLSGLAV